MRWPFPPVVIPPNDYLLIFASGKDRPGPPELHSNFSLKSGGEYIAVVAPDGTTVLGSEAPFTVTGQNAAAGTATATGTHYVSITDGTGGTDTDYSFVIWVIDQPIVPVELQSFSID